MIASLFVFVLLVQGSMSQCASQAAAVGPSDIQAMISATNAFRSQLAMGQLVDSSGHGMDMADNMLRVQWNQSMADVAQKWADCCKYSHSSTDGVGENIFAQGGRPADATTNFNLAVGKWSAELPNNWVYRPDNVFTGSEPKVVGHYTQLGWASTSSVGCGYASCPNIFPTMPTSIFVVCQYYPAGNMEGGVVYNPNPQGCNSGSCTNAAQTTGCDAQGLCT